MIAELFACDRSARIGDGSTSPNCPCQPAPERRQRPVWIPAWSRSRASPRAALLHFLERSQDVGAFLVIEDVNACMSLLDLDHRAHDLLLRFLGQGGYPFNEVFEDFGHRYPS